MLNFPLSQTIKYHLKWKKVYLERFANIPDRKILNDLLLPGLADKDSISSILDIGCEWYNLHHQRAFSKHDYTTIDIEEDRKAFGAKTHVTGSVLELDQHFGKGQFDLVIANGIIGHGVTKKEDVETMAQQLSHAVKPGGFVLIGWNDRGNGTPETTPEEALTAAGFSPSKLPFFPDHRHLATKETLHWFELYERTDSTESISINS